MFQVVAPVRLLCRMLGSFAVMASMLVKLVTPTVEVPLNPLALSAVRFTVAAAKADRLMLSDPLLPLMVVIEPAAPNVNVSPPVPAVRLVMPVNVYATPPVTEPPSMLLMVQAFAAASVAVRLSDPPPVRMVNPAKLRVCPLFTSVSLAPTFHAAALPIPFCNVPPAALVMLSMLLNVPVMPTEEVPLYPLPVPDEVRATVAAAKADRSRLSDPVPPLRVPMLPAAPNTKLSPLLSASSVPKLVYVNV